MPVRPIRILSLALLSACALFDLAAFAAPLPRLRGGSAGLPGLAGARGVFAPAPADGGLDAACGTNLDAVAEQIAAHAERLDDSPQPTPHSRDADGIAVLEDDGTFFYANSGGRLLLDIAAATRAFYRTHGDDYDFIAFYLASGNNQWLGSPGALAAAWPIRNDTQGVGLPQFDYGAAFGSAARLQVPMTMNGLQRYPADPDAPIGGPGDTFTTMDVLAHEFGHRWLAYTFVDSAGTTSPALLGRDYQHWGFFFDADSSYMEGCDWTIVRPDSFVTSGVSATYGALDQYLMGLRTHAEMDSFFTVNAPTDFNPPGTYIPISNPQVGVGCRGRATWWTLANVEAVNGVRVPDGSVAPHRWRIAFALIVPRGTDASAADLAKLGVIRTRFPRTIIESTGGRGSVDVSLDSHAGSVMIAHTPLPCGVTVYVAGRAVDVVVIVATGLQPNWSMVGNGGFGVVELTVNVCAPAPGPLNASELGVTATELVGGLTPGGSVGPVTGVELLLPPPHAERHSTAPATAKNGCKRESIEPDLLATFG